MSKMRKLTYEEYTVGWICALPLELAASITMLDEEDSTPRSDRTDSNTYTFGRVDKHNVVMACLPAGHIGTSSAATVAAQMMTSFRSMKFTLMVGVGGGVPSRSRDIRLGDVVVSKPGSKGGGVVQYDYGKTVAEGKFVRTGSLNAPPEVLLSALSKLQAKHILNINGIDRHLSTIPQSLSPKFTYPGAKHDQLFRADYEHHGGATCENCDISYLVQRAPRATTNPSIHYGIIASANSVMVNGKARDRLAKEVNAICFEMEAAGLMNSFPSVVIRGICDYADSHKNNKWKFYAAVTAAAFAKELLCFILPEQMTSVPAIVTPVHSPTPETVPVSRSSSNVSPHSFFSRYFLLPPNSVALGRLVLDRGTPEQDFCPVAVHLTKEDIDITYRPRLRETIESARDSNFFQKLADILHPLKVDDGLPQVQETTYTLLNSGDVFKRVCKDEKIREWIEETTRHNWSVYMIIGIHTIHESSINNRDSDRAGICAPLDGDDGQLESNATLGSPAARELVFATMYRKVRFKWLSRGEIDKAYLNMGCNRWKVIPLGGRDHSIQDVETNILEVSLMDAHSDDDVFGGETHVINNQLVIF